MNYLLIIFAIIMLLFVIRGSQKGMLLIIYGLVGWIVMLVLINYSTPIINEYLTNKTTISDTINDKIYDRLSENLDEREKDNPGHGLQEIIEHLPVQIMLDVQEGIDNYEEKVLKNLSSVLTVAAIDGISSLAGMVAGFVFLFLGGKIIKLFGYLPVIKDINRVFGMAAGFFEGLLFVWLIMYLADCFSTTTFGQFVIENSTSSDVLNILHTNNIIARFVV